MSIYEQLLRIPLIGTAVYIANCYVFGGDREAVSRFAPLSLWLKALFVPVGLSVVLTGIVLWPLVEKLASTHKLTIAGLSKFAQAPGDLVVSVVPNLLGFGIGVYALIFALAGPIVRDLEDSIDELKRAKLKKQGSVLAINSDLAYPLMVLVVVLALGVFQKGNDSIELLIATWVAFWYALVVLLEVIGVLFGLGDHSLLEKLEATRKTGPASSGGTDSHREDSVR